MRLAALAFLTGLLAAGISYLQVTVPINGARLVHTDAVYYWPVAVVSTLVVLIAAAAIGWLSLWRRRG